MQDNDLSAAPTPRYWVTADVVFAASESTETKKSGWFGWVRSDHVVYTPDLRTLSALWQWSQRLGCRLELLFFDEQARDAHDLWESLDFAANPFNEHFVFGTVNDAVAMLPYRSDLLGVIDRPDRVLVWGGKGLTMASLHG